ncbi:fimbrial protein [Glaciimonas sp. GS1]|uniref:Fimbrial protein n=2 Tax=Glaciimonas soli TaxID=2590999 RepID=A0A843Z0W8_9BURK|nr:fimbrial protein [Glaciimonas soli]
MNVHPWIKQHGVRLLQIMLLCGAGLFAQSAAALQCSSLTDGSYLTESIGPVSVPDSVPDGTIIWYSQTHVVPAKCWKDYMQYQNLVDDIYFYGNPNGLNTLGWGIEFGLLYKGVTAWDGDWSSAPHLGVFTGFSSPPCPDVTTIDQLYTCSLVQPSIAFQVVIRKRGLLPFQRPPQDTYDVFQLDGVLGMNGGSSNPRGNFRYQLSGLQNIVGTPCTVDVTVTPEPGIINFGQIQKTSTGFNPANPTKPFSLALDKQCTQPINIAGYFNTPYQNGDLVLPAADSQFGIQIKDAGGKVLPVNERFPLANFAADVNHIDVPFSATVVPIGDPQIGPFEAIVTVQIIYL